MMLTSVSTKAAATTTTTRVGIIRKWHRVLEAVSSRMTMTTTTSNISNINQSPSSPPNKRSRTCDNDSNNDDSVLPILDISQWYDSKQKESFVHQLRVACHEIGFFMIKHDIPNTIIERQLEQTSKFFEQSTLEQKLSIGYEHSPSFRGYMKCGVENTSGKIDYREQIEYAVEYDTTTTPSTKGRNNAIDTNGVWPPYQRLKIGTNPWPTSFQPTLQPSTLEYAQHACRIADVIRKALCLALNVPETALDHLFQPPNSKSIQDNELNNVVERDHEQPHWVLKLISYPPPKSKISITKPTSHVDTDHNDNEREQEEQQQGVGAHTDTNFLTLVLQDDTLPAHQGLLQVYSKGEWVPVPCTTSTSPNVSSPADTTATSRLLVCNLGEQAELWSRGYFLATPHKVMVGTNKIDGITPSNKTSGEDRQEQHLYGSENEQKLRPRTSVALFYNPCLSSIIEPIPIEELDTNKSNQVHGRNDQCALQDASNEVDKDRTEKSYFPSWTRSQEYDKKRHWRRSNNAMISTVGSNTFKSLARSHPTVFQKHHSDLQLLPDGRVVRR